MTTISESVNSAPTIIAIVGASASGKTLFAQTIFDELLPELGKDRISIIKEDSYYRNQDHLAFEDRLFTNYDHPNAFEHELLGEHLEQLSNGKAVDCPVYCYQTHTRTSDSVKIEPTPIILLEGIMLLSDEQLRNQFDIKVYMDTPLDICLLRRIQRDTVERGRTIESITEQYVNTVRPMYYQHIEPAKSHADVVITRGGKNRMAIELLKAKIRQLTK